MCRTKKTCHPWRATREGCRIFRRTRRASGTNGTRCGSSTCLPFTWTSSMSWCVSIRRCPLQRRCSRAMYCRRSAHRPAAPGCGSASSFPRRYRSSRKIPNAQHSYLPPSRAASRCHRTPRRSSARCVRSTCTALRDCPPAPWCACSRRRARHGTWCV